MLSKLLALLAKLNSPELLKALEGIRTLISIFSAVVPAPAPVASGGNLEQVQLSEEDQRNVECITQKLSAPGTQGAFDVSQLSAFAKLIS